MSFSLHKQYCLCKENDILPACVLTSISNEQILLQILPALSCSIFYCFFVEVEPSRSHERATILFVDGESFGFTKKDCHISLCDLFRSVLSDSIPQSVV